MHATEVKAVRFVFGYVIQQMGGRFWLVAMQHRRPWSRSVIAGWITP